MPFNHLVALREIAKGDQDAFSCLNAIFTWYHALDDLIDQDKPIILSWIIVAHLNFVQTIADNLFFQTNKEKLLPVIQAGALAYLSSEKFRKHASPLYRIASQVLKSQYQDLFFAVAFILGGYDHAVEMSAKYRDFDFDPTPAPHESILPSNDPLSGPI